MCSCCNRDQQGGSRSLSSLETCPICNNKAGNIANTSRGRVGGGGNDILLIFYWKYMNMCFHGNQISWAIKHPLISLSFKYHSSSFICFPVLLAPVISSLDGIYCMTTFINGWADVYWNQMCTNTWMSKWLNKWFDIVISWTKRKDNRMLNRMSS